MANDAEGVCGPGSVHVVMGYDSHGYGTLFGVFSVGEGADQAMRPKKHGGRGVESLEGVDLVSHEVVIDAPLRRRLVYPRT